MTLIKMADLKTCVEALGLEDVSTYIESGNVLFATTRRDPVKLETEIERANVAFVVAAPTPIRSCASEPDPAVEDVKAIDGAILDEAPRDQPERQAQADPRHGLQGADRQQPKHDAQAARASLPNRTRLVG